MRRRGKIIHPMGIVILLLILVRPVFALPPLPATFWGRVSLNGSDAPAGTQVTAWIGSSEVDVVFTQTDGGESYYALQIAASDAWDPDGEQPDLEGQTLHFSVGGLPASQTATWHTGAITELDLTAASEETAAIAGSVTLPGRPAPPDDSWTITLTVRLLQPGTGAELHSYQVTTDDEGLFRIEGISPETYDIVVKGSNTLSRQLDGVELAGGDNTIDFGALAGGDANGDDCVGLADLSVLASEYNTCGSSLRADFNGDGCVGLADLSILASNYGECGPIGDVAGRLFQQPAYASLGSVNMVAGSANVHVNDSFWVAISIQASTQEVDTAEADIRVNPNYLRILNVTTSGPLNYPAPGNSFDASAGTIKYAATKLGAPFPTGTFNLCLVQLQALQTTAGTKIDLVAPSSILRNGASVLGSLVDGTIVISPAPTPTHTRTPTSTGTPTATGTPTRTPTSSPTPTATPSVGAMRASVFDDVNQNGQRDAGESLVAGAILTVTNSSPIQLCRYTTGSSGIPTGFDLPPGSYTIVAEVPPEYALSDPSRSLQIMANQWVDVEFGAVAQGAFLAQPHTVIASLGTVNMVINPGTLYVTTGSTFQVSVLLTAGSQEVDTAEADILVDPTYMQLLGVSGAGPLNHPAPGNYVSASTGRLKYAAAKLGEPFPTGNIAFCNIQIKALRAVEGKPIQFVAGSSVMRDGSSVLGLLIGGNIVIRDPTPTSTHAPTQTPTVTSTPTVTPTPTPAVGGLWVSVYHDLDGDDRHDLGEPDLPGSHITLRIEETLLGDLTLGSTGKWGWDELLEGIYTVDALPPDGYSIPSTPRDVSVDRDQWSQIEFGAEMQPTSTDTATPIRVSLPMVWKS